MTAELTEREKQFLKIWAKALTTSEGVTMLCTPEETYRLYRAQLGIQCGGRTPKDPRAHAAVLSVVLGSLSRRGLIDVDDDVDINAVAQNVANSL